MLFHHWSFLADFGVLRVWTLSQLSILQQLLNVSGSICYAWHAATKHTCLARSEIMLGIGLCRIRISTHLLDRRFSSEERDYNGTSLVSNCSSLPLFAVVFWFRQCFVVCSLLLINSIKSKLNVSLVEDQVHIKPLWAADDWHIKQLKTRSDVLPDVGRFAVWNRLNHNIAVCKSVEHLLCSLLMLPVSILPWSNLLMRNCRSLSALLHCHHPRTVSDSSLCLHPVVWVT